MSTPELSPELSVTFENLELPSQATLRMKSFLATSGILLLSGGLLVGAAVIKPMGPGSRLVDSTGIGTSSGGPTTFERALRDANILTTSDPNYCGDPCTITFSSAVFNPTTPGVIGASFSPYQITAPNVIIDGYTGGAGTPNTQPFGSASDAMIGVALDTTFNSGFDGITVLSTATNVTIKGLAIQRFVYGIDLQSSGAVISGNFIGTAFTGNSGFGNNSDGILINGSNNTVGGSAPADRNIIGKNGSSGVYVASGSGNNIGGNYIGVAKDSVTAVGNTNGLESNGANNIGLPGQGNLISGNLGTGMFLSAPGNIVLANRIGTNAAGTGALGSQSTGISVLSDSNDVGSTSPGEENVIGGNGTGITVTGSNNDIVGNFIGESVGGAPIPNGQGILVQGNGNKILLGKVSNSSGSGVVVKGFVVGNEILGNSIHDNVNLGIDLTDFSGLFNGPTLNDPGDLDSGAGNNLQNFPVINSAVLYPDRLEINLSLDSQSATNSAIVELYKVDPLFANAQSGQVFLQNTGCVSVPGGVLSNAAFTVSPVPPGVAPGDQIVALASSYSDAGCSVVYDGTSEFSVFTGGSAVVAPPPGIIYNTNDSGPGSLRQAIEDNNALACSAPCNIVFNIPTSDPGFNDVYFTITPLSPLPALTSGNPIIDGASQTLFSGDSNPFGPEIFLDGTFAGPVASGLTLTNRFNVQIRNLAIGNFSLHGIHLTSSGSNIVAGNYVGLKADGTTPAPNGDGLYLEGASGLNIVGGPLLTSNDQNIISGNIGSGIYTGSAAGSNSILGNLIGVSRSGNPLGNGGAGLDIDTANNIIGQFGAGNTIANNGGPGIALDPSALGDSFDDGNRIFNNSIFDNGGLGIDINDDGVTANDPLDPDTGPNNQQNFPILTDISFNPSSNLYEVNGTLNSTPSTNFVIDVYESAGGEGVSPKVSGGVTTDLNGDATFSFFLCCQSGAYGPFVATATPEAPPFDTSEFSNEIFSQADLQITKDDGLANAVAGSTLTYTVTATNTGPLDVIAFIDDTFSTSIYSSVTWDCVAGGGANCDEQFPLPPQARAPLPDSLVVPKSTATSQRRRSATRPAKLKIAPFAGQCLAPVSACTGDINQRVFLPVGGTLTFTINATTYATLRGTVDNTATVSFDDPAFQDPTPLNNTDTDLTDVFAVPTISGFSPSNGPVGSMVVITGTGFTGTTSVAFNGTGSSYLIDSDTQITATVPGGATTGPIVVTNPVGSATSATNFTVTATLTIITSTLPNGSVGAPYSQTVVAAGGTPPYTFLILTGTLPTGLTMDSAGNITGTPTTVGTFNFTVQVTDILGAMDAKPLAITIDGADLAVIKTGPASFTPGQNITFTIAVKNFGPASAAGVMLGDTTPAGLTFVSATTPCTGGFPCSLGTLPASPALTSVSVTYSVPAGYTPTTISNTATVTSSTFDPSSANNSSTVVVSGGGGADLMVTKTGPSTVSPGTKVSYTITVENLGPAPAIGVSLFDMTSSGLIFDSASAPCAGGFPCSLGSMASGAVSTITAIFLVTQPAGVVSVTNTASVSSSPADPFPSNDSSTVTSSICPASAPEILEPAEGATFPSNPVTFRFTTPAGTKHTELYAVTSSSARPVFLGSSTTGTITADVPLDTTAVFVTGFPLSEGCGSKSSARRSLTVTGCPLEAPQRIEPADNASLTSNPVTFRYSTVGGGSLYEVFILTSPTATPVSLGTSPTGTLTADVQPGTLHWYVEAIGPSESCSRKRSSTGQFSQTACQVATPNRAPKPAIPGETTSTEIYELSWTLDGGTNDTIYEIDESLDKDFSTLVSRQRVTGLTSTQFVHDVGLPAGYFYRIRVVVVCQGENFFGPDSVVVRIVVLPPPPPAQFQPDQTQQFGIPDPLEQSLFIPGDDAPVRSGLESQGNTGKSFTVVTSQPWLTAKPPAGTVPPQGVVVVVTAVPAGLPVGTNSGTVSVVTPTPTGTSPLSTTPISINLVTPVTPTPKNLAPPPNTLFIPSVSHVNGIKASYQSDVRIANTSGAKVRYQVSFTPSRVDGTNQGKQTIVEIEGGATIAMDDIVKRWYGLGSLGDGTLGSIEIRPLDFAGKTLTPDAFQFATVASSRTYNQTLTGSLSQFVPAVQFGDFVFKGTGPSQATALSMQQIAQSASYRTNLGIVEGSGQAATVQVRTFNNAGTLLDTFFLTMLPAEHVQLTSVLASRNITLDDGRIEVQLTSDTGKITAFATVIDTRSGDPLLVPGVQLSKVGASRYVVPGLSHISNDRNQWRSEMRIFNAGLSSQDVLLTFIPANNTAGAKTATFTVAPGEVKPLDNIVETTFGLTNVVGAVQVSTPSQSALVVTSRTYDSRFGGTVGQFAQAVTPDQAAGVGDRALQVLQLEESSRFRTNLGLAEVSGSGSVELEITAVVPEARVAPVLRLTLAPNEFRQIGRILSQMGLSDAYNTRLSIKVMSGNGRVTAYGSVIDSVTQDPYNVQAQ